MGTTGSELHQPLPDSHGMTRIMRRDHHVDGLDRYWCQDVLFGSRVKAGNEHEILVDYCCGDSAAFQNLVYQCVAALMARQARLEEFPVWRVRPIFRESQVVEKLVAAAGIRMPVEVIQSWCKQLSRDRGFQDEKRFIESEPWRRI